MHSLPLAAEPIFTLGGLPITNAMIATWLTMLVLIILAVLIRRGFKSNYSGVGGNLVLALEGLVGMFEDILGWALTKKMIAFLGTFFIFILLANWLGLVPGFGSITVIGETGEPVPLLRGATTDLHTTLALAILSVIFTQIWGFIGQGWRYLKKFINFGGPILLKPINIFVGLLELISEAAKVLSFGFRLFGNVFAGEVLLTIMLGLIPIVVPTLFYGLELFVGFIQAFVFVMLTAVFWKMASEAHEEH